MTTEHIHELTVAEITGLASRYQAERDSLIAEKVDLEQSGHTAAVEEILSTSS